MAKIKRITRKRIHTETLMNLAVKEDESFVANEIVVHNCKSYLRANLKSSKNLPEISSLSPTAKAKESITL